MTASSSQPLLDLDTLIERKFIRIAGVDYDLRSPAKLSVIESHRFVRWGEQIKRLQAVDSEEAEAELEAVVGHAARAAFVDIPDEIFDDLSGNERWSIVEVFTALLLASAMTVAGAMQRAAGVKQTIPTGLETLTGESFSPASSGSTAETRVSGWRKFLRFWFAVS